MSNQDWMDRFLRYLRIEKGVADNTIQSYKHDLEMYGQHLGETSILKGQMWRVEQTLFALCASRHGKGGLLPKTYEISLGKNSAEDCIARNYIGTARDRFYGEGMKRLRPVLFAGESR